MIKDEALDIMFYDSSDWAGEQLRFSWITGGKFYKMFRGVEHHAGFSSWEDALKWLSSLEEGKKINSIQFWGHGTPGRVWINGDFLSIRSVIPQHSHNSLLHALKARLTKDSVIWFRSCNVFAGSEGHLFATIMSSFFNCKVAGHTYIVGPWQSGLHTITPEQRPSWSKEEGLKNKKDGTVEKLWSTPWAPNTIFCLTGKIPESW